jgi:hypothetical protein
MRYIMGEATTELKPQGYYIPEGERPRKCKGCGATIYFVTTPAGRIMPVNPDGTPHWGDCVGRDLFSDREAQA